jgi:hypothetical protein
VEIVPAQPSAQNLFDAFVAVQEAQAELDKIASKIPDYTGQWSDEDYTGEAENAVNRAMEAFEDALVASVQERTKPEPHIHATSGN